MTDTNSDGGTQAVAETDDPDAESGSGSRLGAVPWRRIANVVGLIVLVAVVVPFVVYAVPQVVGAEHSYVVLSGSMEPDISAGDAVIVNSVPPEKIEEGDVITYGAGTPTTHRVIAVVERDGSVAFQTRGDATPDVSPETVPAEQVHGRVMSVGGYLFVIPYIGHVIQFANTQLGFILLVGVPVVLLVASEIWNILASVRSGAEPDGDADDGAGSAAGAGVDATAEDSETTDGETETETGVTLSAADLRLGLLALAAFLVYGAWVAYTTLETWAFGVAGGVGAAFVLLSGLYLVGRIRATGDAESATGGGIAFSGTELQLGLAVLAAFLVYSAWVTYTLLEPWSVGATGGGVVAFVLFSGMYLLGGEADGATPDPGPDADQASTDGAETASQPSDAATGSGDSPATATEGSDGTSPTPNSTPDVGVNLLDDVAEQRDGTRPADAAAAGNDGSEPEQRPDEDEDEDEESDPDDAGPVEVGPDEPVTDGGSGGGSDD